MPNFQALEGVRVGPGWNREIRDRVGGVAGCTHLAELLGRLGTVCYQTIFPDRRRTEPDGDFKLAKRLIDTCHAWRADGPVVAGYFPSDSRYASPERERDSR